MKKTRNFSIFTILSLVTLCSCQNNYKKVGIFIYDKNDTFIRSLEKEIKSNLNNEFDLLQSEYAETNQTMQNEQIVYCLENNNPQLLLVNIVDRLAASSIIEKTSLTNTPVIFFNREPLFEDLKGTKNIYYVGINPTKEGNLQAELVNDIFEGNVNFLNKYDKNHDGKVGTMVYKGSMNHQDAELRMKNSIKRLEELGYTLDLLSVKYCDWQRNLAYEEFANEYNEYKDEIELVLSGNDDMALGVIDYLKTLPEYLEIGDKEFKDYFFPIVGNDATDVAIESIQNGELSGTIVNNAYDQAEAIYEIAKRIFIEDENKWNDFPYTFNNSYYVHIEPQIYVKETKSLQK